MAKDEREAKRAFAAFMAFTGSDIYGENQFVEWERPFVGIGGRSLQWGVNAKLTWMMDETHIRKAVYPSVLEQ